MAYLGKKHFTLFGFFITILAQGNDPNIETGRKIYAKKNSSYSGDVCRN